MAKDAERDIYSAYDGRQNFQNMIARRTEQIYYAHLHDKDQLFTKTMDCLKADVNGVLKPTEREELENAHQDYRKKKRELRRGKYVGVIGQEYKMRQLEELNQARMKYYQLLIDFMHKRHMLLPYYMDLEEEYDEDSLISGGGL